MRFHRILMLCFFAFAVAVGCDGCEPIYLLRPVDGEYRTAPLGPGEYGEHLVVGEEVDFEFGSTSDYISTSHYSDVSPVEVYSAGSTDESIVMISKIVYGVGDAEFTTITLEALSPGQTTLWVETSEAIWERQIVVVPTQEELPEELREVEDAGGDEGAVDEGTDGA